MGRVEGVGRGGWYRKGGCTWIISKKKSQVFVHLRKMGFTNSTKTITSTGPRITMTISEDSLRRIGI